MCRLAVQVYTCGVIPIPLIVTVGGVAVPKAALNLTYPMSFMVALASIGIVDVSVIPVAVSQHSKVIAYLLR